MISTHDRQAAVALIREATVAGARHFMACREIGINSKTYRRWVSESGQVKPDQRPEALRPVPANALTQEERAKVLEVANRPEFASRPPSQIVPILADRGEYLASESSFYRILREEGLQHRRGRAAHPRVSEPKRHCAQGPNEVWVWDITWLPGPVTGSFFYLYMMIDLYSRKVVGWEVFEEQSAECAANVLHKASLAECRGVKPLVLHSDNGSPMKGATLLTMLQKLGIAPSFNRPGVSDDNAHAEAFFRTLKYRPGYPSKGFARLEEAREWVMGFVEWYNVEHRHSGIQFVTPAQRHRGEDGAVLQARDALYQQAKAKHPARWSGPTRNWEKTPVVWLNQERQKDKDL
jgi:putative transposase